MAAQHSTVTTDSVTFKLVIEWAVRGFRSQHRVSKYNNNPNNDKINNAAGAEPKSPKLYSDEQRKKEENKFFVCSY